MQDYVNSLLVLGTMNFNSPLVKHRFPSQKSTIICIIFWDFLMFYQIFLSPQVKQCAIINYEHGTYELPHELPNDLRLSIVRNYEILGKRLNFIEW